MPTPTKILSQYLKIKKDYKDSILFYQNGDFYEMLGIDAIIAAEILDIRLISRKSNSTCKRIPMCGFPLHTVDSRVSQLVRSGMTVVVCNEINTGKPRPLEHKVVRVASMGLASNINSNKNISKAGLHWTKEGYENIIWRDKEDLGVDSNQNFVSEPTQHSHLRLIKGGCKKTPIDVKITLNDSFDKPTHHYGYKNAKTIIQEARNRKKLET